MNENPTRSSKVLFLSLKKFSLNYITGNLVLSLNPVCKLSPKNSGPIIFEQEHPI